MNCEPKDGEHNEGINIDQMDEQLPICNGSCYDKNL